jgi:hypothetical protein
VAVHVRLAAPWVDGTGTPRGRGDIVDIDAVTLAQLEEAGIVTDPSNEEFGQLDDAGSTGGEKPAEATEAGYIGPGGATDEQATQVTPTSYIGPGSATDGEGTGTTQT